MNVTGMMSQNAMVPSATANAGPAASFVARLNVAPTAAAEEGFGGGYPACSLAAALCRLSPGALGAWLALPD